MKRRNLLWLLTLMGVILFAIGLLWWNTGPLPSHQEINKTLYELAICLHQGQTLVQAIKHAASKATNPRLKRAWEDVLRLVSQGRSLSRSMSAHRDVFPAGLIDTVLQGEIKGNLDIALMQRIGQSDR